MSSSPKFKVGDKVRRLRCDNGNFRQGQVREVTETDEFDKFVKVTDCDHWQNPHFLELVEEPRRHKHADLIIAWANGATIQLSKGDSGTGGWVDVSDPSWSTACDYRIKPAPKPDVVKECYILSTAQNKAGIGVTSTEMSTPNVKFTFDGETGKLKSVELIPSKELES